MKTLSIKQPWASLICAGIKDIENRTWKAAQVPGRILIHASSRKVTKNFFAKIPEYLGGFINNEINFGNFPELDTLPTSAIVGYVTVSAFEEGNVDSIWAEDGAVKWKLENAWMFDEPILNVNGKLNLFDYDEIDENNLPPAHQIEMNDVALNDAEDEVYIPCKKEIFERIKEGKSEGVFLFLTGYLVDLLCVEDDYKMKPFKSVTVGCGMEYMTFELAEDSGIFDVPDPNDREKSYIIRYPDGEVGAWMTAQFIFGKKLDEGKFNDESEVAEEKEHEIIDYSNDRNTIVKVKIGKNEFNEIKNGLKEYALDIPHQELEKYCEMDEDGEVKIIDEEIQPRKYKAIQFVCKQETYTCKLDYARVAPKQYIDDENYTYIYEGKEYSLLQIVFELGDEIK